ncbi:MAG: 30S ribosomal protein S18 [Candidatus Raymondbacteria bacterium RifOxyA12_full_50_37]|uniref:Small ribosomal subunit protein bS18 n=1 Tax=Candidatus Raymondbacteria bacterium RIFOXYD12_FULL_49_13 TaxID=1817890 RepID=A0A1F7F5I2_UNCRA|nr:MAG: 30S ribosomal protein S18 [Candidatus Raymondbacteria bacterium RifOxyA12_full_50_37]OGJ89244.1 MAG: 30S ribosomal protein S18 [Candidatus Raymondbacteria bacterium RIFOXYA2_FULL_49_16]OGJ96468.1 MAG: 30S ribosomal protein S18 [Candidatus Raymondbacteria bacterium RifOxyC12_full_50_8]OGJ97410.1 MAG: 30S ribosomal protein S18 [Candidatus Raymondbacteria bacterium RIFOXYC2_FULL_50_21]OGK01925.1 MAG: 30S ribosomal protein S18 [Candidatus Raymondbacteria bacterium RIFOXYD12_FULL_49_13]OGP4
MINKRMGPGIERVKTCFFCHNKNEKIDYKDEKMLYRYMSERGKISDRGRTGLCAGCQREMAKAIKRARHIAIIPFVQENIR